MDMLSKQQDNPDWLKQQVLGYLLRHPEAQDTVEGIAEWWLLERRVEQALANVTKVLSELVAKDYLMATKAEDGRLYYRLNRAKEREISAQLRNANAGTQLGSKSEMTET
jgi:hypothetical protein